ALRGNTAMHAFNLDDGADWAGLFDSDVLHIGREALPPRRVLGMVGGPALQNTDKLSGTGNIFAPDADGGDEIGTAERDGAFERACVDENSLAVIVNAESVRGGRGCTRRECNGTLKATGQHSGKASPLNRAVRPDS